MIRLSDLPSHWPTALWAGLLFFALWVPIVLLAAAKAYRKDPEIGSRTDWVRAVRMLLALGLPLAIGFGIVFYLEGAIGGGIVVTVVVVAVAAVLIGWLLPRLNRWS